MTRKVNRMAWNVSVPLLGLSCATSGALAQTSPDQWQFDAIVYLYFPEITGTAVLPTSTTADISVDPHQLISNLNFGFMGAFEARKGPWSVFTDLIYVDASGSKSGTHALSVGGLPIAADVTAYAHLDVTSTIWTIAGSYRVVALPEATLDLVAGTRGLFLDQRLNYQFSSNVGPLIGPARQGSGDFNPTNWDGIVGVKGQWMFGEDQKWFVPVYLDVGTGASQLTWQGIGGVGYKFSWGQVIGGWRYLDYHFSSHSSTLALNGPVIGVGFHW
jgi:hypothetical protein